MHRGFTYYIRDKTNPDLVYYGSSELPTVDDRIKSHLNNFNYWKKNSNQKYCSSYKVLEKDNYEYDTIDVVYFDTTYDLRQYERLLIEGKICVNMVIPNRTMKEWREANPNYNTDYYQVNIEQCKKKNRERYYQNHDYCLKKSIEYSHTHKNEKKEYDKLYYQKKKEEKNSKIKCEVCDCYFVAQGIKRHNKTKKHQKWVESQITET